jgi:hypothetical protein
VEKKKCSAFLRYFIFYLGMKKLLIWQMDTKICPNFINQINLSYKKKICLNIISTENLYQYSARQNKRKPFITTTMRDTNFIIIKLRKGLTYQSKKQILNRLFKGVRMSSNKNMMNRGRIIRNHLRLTNEKSN